MAVGQIAHCRCEKKNSQANIQFTVVPNWWGGHARTSHFSFKEGLGLATSMVWSVRQCPALSFFGVYLNCRVPPCPFQSQLTSSGKEKLGNFRWGIFLQESQSSHLVGGGSVRPELQWVFFLCSVLLLLSFHGCLLLRYTFTSVTLSASASKEPYRQQLVIYSGA